MNVLNEAKKAGIKIIVTKDGHLVNTSDLARVMGISRTTVYNYVGKGWLKPKWIAINKYFSLEEAQEVINKKQGK
jgi:predicted site-specific integrase-resolvase